MQDGDLISRAAAVDILQARAEMAMGTPKIVFEASAKILEKLPSVDVEPVKHGRWEHLGGDEWRCTNCGEIIHTEGSWEKPTSKYCRECGAKMGGTE